MPFSIPNLAPAVFGLVCCSASLAAQLEKMPKDGAELHRLANGLRYSVLRPGTGDARPKPGDRVHFHYVGWFEDGTLFETSRRREEPLQRILGVGMPQAWVLGLGLMKAGARYKVSVPAELCFGKWGSPGKPPDVPVVPPNTPVVFEFELVSFEPGVPLPSFKLPNRKRQRKTATGLKYETLIAPTEGEVETPKNRGRFEVEFSMFNSSAQLVVTSRLPQIPAMRGRLTGKLDGPPFLTEAIGMLRRGERMRFEVPAELCYGKTDRGFLCPPDSETIWELQLLSLEPAPKPRPVPEFARLVVRLSKRTRSGLRYQVIKQGKGEPVRAEDRVELHFAGWQTSGRLFEQSYSEGLPLNIKVADPKVIPGWTEGLQLMRPGAVFRFAVPARLAYGSLGKRDIGIGPNRTVYFQIELLRTVGGAK